MNSLIELIEKLEEKKQFYYKASETGPWQGRIREIARGIVVSDCIDLITTLSETHVLVPKEPDDPMIEKGRQAYLDYIKGDKNGSYHAIIGMYKAMIGADNG